MYVHSAFIGGGGIMKASFELPPTAQLAKIQKLRDKRNGAKMWL